MNMHVWWKRIPSRLLEEDRALSPLVTGESAIVSHYRWIAEPDGEARLRVDLLLAGEVVQVEVRFPPRYPDECPSVRPVPYAIMSSHQFKASGIFCLELGPDNWHPRFTAADMIASAWRLLALEKIGKVEPIEIPSRHVQDLAERVSMGEGSLLRSKDFDVLVAAAKDHTDFEFVWPTRNLLRVLAVAFPKGAARPGVLPAYSHESRSEGKLILLKEGAPSLMPSSPGEFRAQVAEHSGVELDEHAPILVVMRWSDGSSRGFLRLSKGVTALVDVPLEEHTGDRTPAHLGPLRHDAKVAVIGLGSLGSKVAASLARTGIRRFVLVDGDVLLGPNVCRHAAGFLDVGAMKVHAAKQVVRDACFTEPEISQWPIMLGAATNPELHAQMLADIATADIIVDATADPEAFCLTAMLASDSERPLVWGEVFGGGLGGLVASAQADLDPCPRCVRSGFLAALEGLPPAPDALHRGRAYDGDGEQPHAATDADVGFVASMVTSRALDILAGASPAPPNVVMMGFRIGWVFEQPMKVLWFRVRSDDWSCPRCWSPAKDADPHDIELVEQLFAAQAHADDPPAA